ncbi:hypothetical protein STEG23_008008, partial [Scotinomys teguina]
MRWDAGTGDDTQVEGSNTKQTETDTVGASASDGSSLEQTTLEQTSRLPFDLPFVGFTNGIPFCCAEDGIRGLKFVKKGFGSRATYLEPYNLSGSAVLRCEHHYDITVQYYDVKMKYHGVTRQYFDVTNQYYDIPEQYCELEDVLVPGVVYAVNDVVELPPVPSTPWIP